MNIFSFNIFLTVALAFLISSCSLTQRTANSDSSHPLTGSWKTDLQLSQLGYVSQEAVFKDSGTLEWTFHMFGGDKENPPKSITHQGEYRIESQNIITKSPNLPNHLSFSFENGKLILDEGKEKFIFHKK